MFDKRLNLFFLSYCQPKVHVTVVDPGISKPGGVVPAR